jgi:hypothetical protein
MVRIILLAPANLTRCHSTVLLVFGKKNHQANVAIFNVLSQVPGEVNLFNLIGWLWVRQGPVRSCSINHCAAVFYLTRALLFTLHFYMRILLFARLIFLDARVVSLDLHATSALLVIALLQTGLNIARQSVTRIGALVTRASGGVVFGSRVTHRREST